MAVTLLDLFEKALRVAKQALGNHTGKPESGGLPRETHIVARCIHKEKGHTYTEFVDRLKLLPEICNTPAIHPDALPNPTTFYHSLDQYAMYIWWALLHASAQQLRQSGHVALDSAFFERKQASQYYHECYIIPLKCLKVVVVVEWGTLCAVWGDR